MGITAVVVIAFSSQLISPKCDAVSLCGGLPRRRTGHFARPLHLRPGFASSVSIGVTSFCEKARTKLPGYLAEYRGVPVAMSRDSLWTVTNELEVPTFAALAQPRSDGQVRALPAANEADEEDSVALDFVKAVVLPLFLAFALMEADTENPGELCVEARKS
jgi:hypothetical protein